MIDLNGREKKVESFPDLHDREKQVEAFPDQDDRAKGTLSKTSLFLGEVRDGLTMINMQNTFLMTSKNYTEKQAGVIFLVFGLSQFIFQTPAGYIMDYSSRKTLLLAIAAVGTTLLTLCTAMFAADKGANFSLMVIIKFFQGAITTLIPSGLNSITRGIVGSGGMTHQVSRNEMMNHCGTASIVILGSVLAFVLYPNIGFLFVVSPIFCVGVLYYLQQIRGEDIDHNDARGLRVTPQTPIGYTPPSISLQPSFTFGFGKSTKSGSTLRADTPLKVFLHPTLLTFALIIFFFHSSNATVLPLVMQTLAIGNGRMGISMSGLCIIVSQFVMVVSAKICGAYSGIYGRKRLFMVGLASLPIRCLLLTWLLGLQGEDGSVFLNFLILATQIFDGIGAGIFGTLYILVTSDISAGTGRFSFMLGVTTTAMTIGGTISGYLGEALAQDMGYRESFFSIGIMSCLPVLMYGFCMPETLHQNASNQGINTINTMTSIAEGENEDAQEHSDHHLN